MTATLIGWLSSGILLLTIDRQVYTQWKSEQTSGVSRWLFAGQLAASSGFATYSWLLHNWVFLATNIMLIIAALIGDIIFLRNRQRSGLAPTPQ